MAVAGRLVGYARNHVKVNRRPCISHQYNKRSQPSSRIMAANIREITSAGTAHAKMWLGVLRLANDACGMRHQ